MTDRALNKFDFPLPFGPKITADLDTRGTDFSPVRIQCELERRRSDDVEKLNFCSPQIDRKFLTVNSISTEDALSDRIVSPIFDHGCYRKPKAVFHVSRVSLPHSIGLYLTNRDYD